MATYDTNTGSSRTVGNLSNSMWIGLIVLVALIVGGFIWMQRTSPPAVPPSVATQSSPVVAPPAPPATAPAPTTAPPSPTENPSTPK